MIALRTDRHKIVRYPEIDDIDELYDLEADPHELNNLAANPEHAELHARMDALLRAKTEKVGWQAQVFPRNLEFVRGEEGLVLDLAVEDGQMVDRADSDFAVNQRAVALETEHMVFDGASSALQIEADPELEPSTWPFVVTVQLKATSDGAVVSQAGNRYGFKLFLEDGRPGVSTLCRTWKASQTTIDAPDSILGRWAELRAVIHYNRLSFFVDGQLIDSRPLPQPFKGQTRAPLFVGDGSANPVVEDTPNNPIQAEIRRFTIERVLLPALKKNIAAR